MNKTFSFREKILLAILAVLLVGSAYYLLVWKPSTEAVEAAQNRYENIQDEITTQQAISLRRTDIQDKLDELKKSGSIRKTLPDYDNTKNEIKVLNGILSDARSYNVDFVDPTVDGDLARRVVTISFETATYSQARSIVKDLTNCPYSCIMTDVSLDGKNLGKGSNGEGVKGSLSVTFFEKVSDGNRPATEEDQNGQSQSNAG